MASKTVSSTPSLQQIVIKIQFDRRRAGRIRRHRAGSDVVRVGVDAVQEQYFLELFRRAIRQQQVANRHARRAEKRPPRCASARFKVRHEMAPRGTAV